MSAGAPPPIARSRAPGAPLAASFALVRVAPAPYPCSPSRASARTSGRVAITLRVILRPLVGHYEQRVADAPQRGRPADEKERHIARGCVGRRAGQQRVQEKQRQGERVSEASRGEGEPSAEAVWRRRAVSRWRQERGGGRRANAHRGADSERGGGARRGDGLLGLKLAACGACGVRASAVMAGRGRTASRRRPCRQNIARWCSDTRGRPRTPQARAAMHGARVRTSQARSKAACPSSQRRARRAPGAPRAAGWPPSPRVAGRPSCPPPWRTGTRECTAGKPPWRAREESRAAAGRTTRASTRPRTR